ncbi:hypothetical protein HD806DRAFT_537262 [Xylariaceae sp. AK1471]|nr:hypothetical protein HD806DRAFT_537262 [Xylariaceae sp. AK1471]
MVPQLTYPVGFPTGSLVLMTDSNGHIASHIINQLIKLKAWLLEMSDPEHQSYHSTLLLVKPFFEEYNGKDWEGSSPELTDQPPQYWVSIVDTVIAHVAALIYHDMRNERLFAFAYSYNHNDILAIFRW